MDTTTDELILQHEDYLVAIVRRLAARLPAHVDIEELLSCGRLGLVEAARRYKFGQGAVFETYAYYRIRGEIFDWLRKMSILPPSVRRWLQRESAVDTVLENRAANLAGCGNGGEEAARRFVNCVRDVGMVCVLSQAPGYDDDNTDGLEPMDETSPCEQAASRELLGRIQESVGDLPSDHRELLKLHYDEGMSLTQIAEKMGVNKSTITRRHAAAIGLLREALEVDRGSAVLAVTESSVPSVA